MARNCALQASNGFTATILRIKPLTQSSDRGKLTLIGRCHACNPCTRQHCFSWTEDGKLKIEMFGEHSVYWNEPDMAKYLREHIFVETNGGLLDAPWRCGLGCTPLGFTSYAPNAIEVSHRVLKGLLDPAYNKRPVTSIMSEIAEALESRLRSGYYDNLEKEVREPWQALIQSTRKRSAVALSTDPDDDANHTKALCILLFFIFYIDAYPSCGFPQVRGLGGSMVVVTACMFVLMTSFRR